MSRPERLSVYRTAYAVPVEVGDVRRVAVPFSVLQCLPPPACERLLRRIWSILVASMNRGSAIDQVIFHGFDSAIALRERRVVFEIVWRRDAEL